MKYRLKPTKVFQKNLKRPTRDEQRRAARKLNILILRAKKVKSLEGIFECTISDDIRVLWKYEGGEVILLLDIGRHKILDKM
jgi:mRNA-degrading endonuclease YafQ of YafQ-DinJ toxin-antitoxin module